MKINKTMTIIAILSVLLVGAFFIFNPFKNGLDTKEASHTAVEIGEGAKNITINKDGEKIYTFDDGQGGTYEVNENMYLKGWECTSYTENQFDGEHGTFVSYPYIRNTYEDGGCKRIENARSLMDSGYTFKKVEDDRINDYEIKDFNTSSIEFDSILLDNKELNRDIPIKMNGIIKENVNYESIDERKTVILNGNILNSNFTIGEHSTTFQVNKTGTFQSDQSNAVYQIARRSNSSTDIDGQPRFAGQRPGYEVLRSGMSFNTTGLPVGATITQFNVSIYITNKDFVTDNYLILAKNGTFANTVCDLFTRCNKNFTGWVEGGNPTDIYSGINMTYAYDTSGMPSTGWVNFSGTSDGISQLQVSYSAGQQLKLMFLSHNDITAKVPTNEEAIAVGVLFELQPYVTIEYTPYISPTGVNPPFNITINSTDVRYNSTRVNLSVDFLNYDSTSESNISTWYENNNSMLALYLPFDTNVTTVWDYSGYNNTGIMNTTAPIWRNKTKCKIGGCYDLSTNFKSNNKSFMSILYNQNFNFTNQTGINFTVSAWINLSVNTKASDIIGQVNYISSTAWVLGTTTSGSNIKLTFKTTADGTTSRTATSVTNIPTIKKWVYVVGRYNGTATDLLINGTLEATVQGSGLFDSNYNISIAGNWSSGTGFNGTIDEVKIFNKALSNEQIYQNYLMGISNQSDLILVSNETKKGKTYKVAGYVANKTSFGKQINTSELLIRNTPPTVPNIDYPPNNFNTINYTVNLSCSGSYGDDGDTVNYEFWIDNSNPPTTIISNATNQSVIYSFGADGIYYWRCRANDAQAVSNYNDTRLINFDWRYITLSSLTYNADIVEGSQQSFMLNVTYSNILVSDINSAFYYNGINHHINKVSEASNRKVFTSNIEIPFNSISPSQFSFNLTINLNNGTQVYNNSFAGSQNVEKISLYNCTSANASSIELINFSFGRENDYVNISNTFEGYFKYSSSISNNTKEINLLYNNYINVTSVGLCLAPKYSNVYILDGSVKYVDQDNNLYYPRFYYFRNDLFENTSTRQIKLYSLPKYLSYTTMFTIKSSIGELLNNYIVEVYKHRIGSNTYDLISMGKSSIDGTSSLYLSYQDTPYQFLVRDTDGNYKEPFNNFIANADTLIGKATYELKLGVGMLIGDLLSHFQNVNGGLSYNNGTSTFYYLYNDSTSQTEYTRLRIQKVSKTGTYVLEDKTFTGNSAYYYMTIDNSTGNYLLSVYMMDTEGNEFPLYSFEKEISEPKLYDYIGSEGLLASFFIFITYAFMALTNPIAVMVLSLVGVILLTMLGILHISTMTIVMLCALVGGIIIYNLKK